MTSCLFLLMLQTYTTEYLTSYSDLSGFLAKKKKKKPLM